MAEKVLILGGGADQKLLVREFKCRGWLPIVMDYYENPPAREDAYLHCQLSCYDQEAALALAREHDVQLVTTICTDQPLVVAAYISETLGLYTPIKHADTIRLTNKKFMKEMLTAHTISTPRHVVFCVDDSQSVLDARLEYPLVVKPADSSGSRGVSVISTASRLEEAVQSAAVHTRCNTLIAEEFIAGYEVSVDALVVDGIAHLVMLSDNFKVDAPGKTALAARSQYPSRLSAVLRRRVERIIQDVATAFALKNVPLFVQLLVRDQDIFVMELSARLAGGSKPVFIKSATGVDVVKLFVGMLLQAPVYVNPERTDDTIVVHYIYCEPGVIKTIAGFDEALAAGAICWYVLYRAPGDTVRGWDHGGDRVAAYAVRGESSQQVETTVRALEPSLRIVNNYGDNMIVNDLQY